LYARFVLERVIAVAIATNMKSPAAAIFDMRRKSWRPF
jgi:hypothetical protein